MLTPLLTPLEPADLLLLATVANVLLLSYGLSRRAMRVHINKAQAYRLFAVRDQLIYLVATGKLREQDVVFQIFYKAINYFVNETKNVTFRSFIDSMEAGRRKGLDPATEKNRAKLWRALRSADPEVRAAVEQFADAMTLIMVENSALLRFLVAYKWPRRALSVVAQTLQGLGGWLRQSAHSRALTYYGEYERLAA